MSTARLLVFIAIALFSILRPSSAQDDGIGNSCPPVPADPNLSRVAGFRLIYAANAKEPKIALVREVKGQPLSLVDNQIAPGVCSPYLITRPGKLLFHILDGNTTEIPSPEDLKSQGLTEPLAVDLKAAEYRTILIRTHQGKLAATLLEDLTLAPSAAPVMRVLDLSGLDNWGIQLLSRQGKFISNLWRSGAPTQNISIPAPGIYQILVTRNDKGTVRSLATFECKLDAGNSFSIGLTAGSRNRGKAFFAFDGTFGASYDAASVKAMASAPQP